MVHLDTNALIYALVPGTPQDQGLRDWLTAGQPIGIAAPAWAEFLCGPLDPAAVALATTLFSHPEPFTAAAADAARAADLFNATGRRRGSLVDCMIAAVAIRAGAALATENVGDFQRFEPLGLRLVPP